MSPKLICIPYAGGMAENYREFFRYLSDGCCSLAIEYAGHGRRGREPLCPDWQTLLADTAAQINNLIEPGEPYFCLAYSMGNLVLYDILAQNLLATVPRRVFLCAHTPAGVPRASDTYHLLSDEAFADAMRSLGGLQRVDSRMLSNRIFRRMYFEPMRHDFVLIGERAGLPADLSPISEVSATVFYAPEDTPPELIQRWDSCFINPPVKKQFPGNHFFIWDHGEEMAQIILRQIENDMKTELPCS